MKTSLLSVILVVCLGLSACRQEEQRPSQLPSNERLITILQTNDIHGSVEPSANLQGQLAGGMAILGGIVKSIRAGFEARYGDRAGVLLVDGGDQFQGTLISNFDEGQLVFKTMNAIGYDAVVPGNHDYDFGPIGWKEDQVTPTTADQNPRGALLRLVEMAKFPLISANTYLKASLVDESGQQVEVDGSGCKPLTGAPSIQWNKAKRPSFLKPYVIKKTADVRVALIGIDHPTTPQTTTAANVSDLCFRDELETYLEVRKELENEADIFIIVMHNGNSNNEFPATKLAEALTAGKAPLVDGIVAAHTHFVNHLDVNGVPIVQSGANGKKFGRIDLVWDMKDRKLIRSRTKYYGGVHMFFDICADNSVGICEKTKTALEYEHVPTAPDAEVAEIVEQGRKEVAPLSSRKIGEALGRLTTDRIAESSLANMMTDALRGYAGADVAFMNTGGLRAPIEKGEITYEILFSVLPFNNRGVVLEPMPIDKVIWLLNRSIQTCGKYGALMQSGLKVKFERDCTKGDMDPLARLLRVETLSGEVLLDVGAGVAPNASRAFKVATLDFLALGGSGYDGFKGVPVTSDLGIARDVLADFYSDVLKGETRFTPKVDGRWVDVKRQ